MPYSNHAAAPDISVILLTQNAGTALAETLTLIFRQRTTRTFEVVAVDSGSNDGTFELMRDFDITIHQIPPADFNFGATRELGYELGRGRYLVTISQDSVPVNEEWLERLTRPFDDPLVAAVAGAPVLPPPPARIFYWERVGRFYFTRDGQRWLARYHFGFSNTNSAIRKAVWETNRLGPIEMCEDRLLQKTWTSRGMKIVFVPEAAVYHGHYYDLRELVRRSQNEGLGCRLTGEPYSFFDCLSDMANLSNWWTLLDSVARGARPTLAELLFPVVRPFFLWRGHEGVRHYLR